MFFSAVQDWKWGERGGHRPGKGKIEGGRVPPKNVETLGTFFVMLCIGASKI